MYVYGLADSMSAVRTTFGGNVATGSNGGAIEANRPITLTDTVIRDNQAGAVGGGMSIYGSANLNRVTLYGNRSEAAAAIFLAVDAITLTNATVSENTAATTTAASGSATTTPLHTSRTAPSRTITARTWPAQGSTASWAAARVSSTRSSPITMAAIARTRHRRSFPIVKIGQTTLAARLRRQATSPASARSLARLRTTAVQHPLARFSLAARHWTGATTRRAKRSISAR